MSSDTVPIRLARQLTAELLLPNEVLEIVELHQVTPVSIDTSRQHTMGSS